MFKELRERTGYSTEYVSKQLGIKRTTLYKYEGCNSLPSASILLKMKEIYKCDYEELLSAYKVAKEVYRERQNKKRSKQIDIRRNRSSN